MDKYEGNSKALMWFVALVLTGVVAGCGGGGGGGPTLTVPPPRRRRGRRRLGCRPGASGSGNGRQFRDSIKIRNHQRPCICYYWRCWNESNHRCSYYWIRLCRSDWDNIYS